MEAHMDEKALTRKLVLTGHLNVSERKALPGHKARASVIYAVVEEALASGRYFRAWWLPDDSMVGCRIDYRGDGPGRICWRYTGIEGERTWAREYNSWQEAAVALVRDDWRFFGGEIDGVPIDQSA